MAGYLFDERTHLNDVYFRSGDRPEQYWTPYQHCRVFGGKKPVYVLTSHETFSGAEDFTVVLYEKGIIEGASLRLTLQTMINTVEKVITDLKPRTI
jgi:hypothetical protein